MIKIEGIDNGNTFDFGRTAEDYSRFRDIYPAELYEKLRSLGVAADSTSWLDIGTGTGILPQNMYNPNVKTVGVDISHEQIAHARSKAAESGYNIKYITSPAESTGLPDDSFDFITAAQCFWYFDREKMRGEITRLLKNNGVFIKIFLNWSYDDETVKKSLDLVKKYNPSWNSHAGEDDIFDDLFDGRTTEITDCEIVFTRESWHGRMCACRGTLASMTADVFLKWEGEHLEYLSTLPEVFKVKHKLYISYFKVKKS